MLLPGQPEPQTLDGNGFSDLRGLELTRGDDCAHAQTSTRFLKDSTCGLRRCSLLSSLGKGLCVQGQEQVELGSVCASREPFLKARASGEQC